MLGAWSVIRFVHVVSAMVWVGGQLTITAMVMPVVRARLAGPEMSPVMTGVGKRFGKFTVSAFLPLQIGTGLLLAWHKGVTPAALLEPGYGRTLLAKLIAFGFVMLAAGGHGWANGTGRRSLARSLAIASLVASLAVVLLATALPSS
ncbi:MAG: hypothetical protein ACTHNT_11520 [Actinomycetales bacterium]